MHMKTKRTVSLPHILLSVTRAADLGYYLIVFCLHTV